MTYRKKLIEVALPLGRVLSDAERKKLGIGARLVGGINDACAREKSIRHGRPSTLHLWWARRSDFGVTTANHGFTELLARAGEPR